MKNVARRGLFGLLAASPLAVVSPAPEKKTETLTLKIEMPTIVWPRWGDAASELWREALARGDHDEARKIKWSALKDHGLDVKPEDVTV